jgi:urea transport system permease protein
MITQRLLNALGAKVLWVAAIILAVAILVPASNLLLPVGHPLRVPNYMVPLLGKFLSYAMLALALDLVWGYVGILSLGHGAFFALGGYAMGMYLMRQIVASTPIRSCQTSWCF